MIRSWMLSMLAGCAATEVLPVVDGDGGLAGTYDPAEAVLSLDVDGAEVRASTGEVAPLDLGIGVLDRALVPGDALTVYDEAGEVVESFVVGEPDDSGDGEARYAACRLL